MIKNQWRSLMWLVIFLLSTTTLKSQELVVRKNLDDLTALELATYEHAIQILKDRSNVNPYDTTGYAWQAWVHNKSKVYLPPTPLDKIPKDHPIHRKNFSSDRAYYDSAAIYFENRRGREANPGMCVHRKSEFLFWHRAQFYYFERILQETNPYGSKVDSKGNSYPTKLIGVPYWDYTVKASGQRYPSRLEDQKSVLYHKYRALNKGSDKPKPPNNREQFEEAMGETVFWRDFSSRYERVLHNHIHGRFVGGNGEVTYKDDMGNKFYPSMYLEETAAYDPLFYSFHSFIDYALDRWLDEHGVDKILKRDRQKLLRATQPAAFHLKDDIAAKSMGRVELYLSSKQLLYTYAAPQNKDLLIARRNLSRIKSRRFSQGRSEDWILATKQREHTINSAFGTLESFEFALSEETITDNEWVLVGPEHAEYSYAVEVYLHPKNVEAEVGKKSFRKKYLAEYSAAWISPTSHHESGSTQIEVNIGEELRELVAQGKQGEYVVTVKIN